MNTSEIVDSVGMDRFWAEYAWLPAAKGDVSCALLHSGRNATVLHTELSACNHEIGQTEERVKPCRVLGKPTVANLLQTQQVLDDVKRMLDLSPNTRFVVLNLLQDSAQPPSGSARRLPGRIATCQ